MISEWPHIPRLVVVEVEPRTYALKTSSVIDYDRTKVKQEGNLYLTSVMRRGRVVGYVFKFRRTHKLSITQSNLYIVATYNDEAVRPKRRPKMLVDTNEVRVISLAGNFFVSVKARK